MGLLVEFYQLHHFVINFPSSSICNSFHIWSIHSIHLKFHYQIYTITFTSVLLFSTMVLFHFGNSTDAKIRSGTSNHYNPSITISSLLTSAINNEPLGPYNKELLDLSNITYNPKAVVIVEDVLRKKLVRTIASGDKPRRLNSSVSHSFHSGQLNEGTGSKSRTMRRSASVHSSGSSDTKSDLVVLKCLTVMVYLCQYGSGLFIKWLRSEYRDIIVPLGRLAFHPQYQNAIYLKISLLVRYCENDDQLASSRNSLDDVRKEIRPGIVEHSVNVKRTTSPVPLSLTMGKMGKMGKKSLVH